MTDFIKQYYGDTNFIPKELLLPMESTDRDLFNGMVYTVKRSTRNVSVPQRGYKMDMIKMAHENAETFLEERRRQWQHQIDKTGGGG